MNIRKWEINAELKFKGGVEADKVHRIPTTHGIYVVFAWIDLGKEYECKKIIYIGKAEGTDNLRSRVADHVRGTNQPKNEQQKYWEYEFCKNGEVIVYVYAEQERDYRYALNSSFKVKNNVGNDLCAETQAFKINIQPPEGRVST